VSLIQKCFIILIIPISDTFLAVVTSATEIGNTRPFAASPESVARIHEVGFYSLTSSTWDELPPLDDPMFPGSSPDPTESTFRETVYAQSAVFEHPCLPLTKILSSGSFYYAFKNGWDISSRLGVRLARDREREVGMGQERLVYDERFVWNEYIIRSLLDFRERLEPHEREELDRCQFLVCSCPDFYGFYIQPRLRRYLQSKDVLVCSRWHYPPPQRTGRQLCQRFP